MNFCVGFPADRVVYDSPVKTPKELQTAIGNPPNKICTILETNLYYHWLMYFTVSFDTGEFPTGHNVSHGIM